jgi:hypothetical protein
MGTGYYKLVDKKPVETDMEGYIEVFKDEANRRVALDKLDDDVSVSTVFLCLDHGFGDGPPVLFETMIFGGPNDQYQERYFTWEQAEKGHAVALEIAKSGKKVE